MTVKIRLARIGQRHQPLYKIRVANSWAKRDGKFIEQIGSYDPRPDDTGVKYCDLDFERVKYWISVGAQPTNTVSRLLGKVKHFQLIDLFNFLGRFTSKTAEIEQG